MWGRTMRGPAELTPSPTIQVTAQLPITRMRGASNSRMCAVSNLCRATGLNPGRDETRLDRPKGGRRHGTPSQTTCFHAPEAVPARVQLSRHNGRWDMGHLSVRSGALARPAAWD